MYTQRLLCAGIILVLSAGIGCAGLNVRTDARSFKDPICAETQVKKILVFSNTDDIQYRDHIETNMVKYFEMNNYDCIAVKSLDIFLPTRTYTEKELKQLFDLHSIDAVLFFEVQDSGYTHQQYTTTFPKKTTGDIYGSGDVKVFKYTPTITGPQTYNFYKPHLSAEAHLYDADRGIKLWTVQLNSYGNAFAHINDTLNDAIKTLIRKLEQDGVIKKNKK